MNALEIIWILLTVGNIWCIVKLAISDIVDGAVFFMIVEAVSIALLIGY